MAGNTMGTCPLGGLWYTCTAQTPTFLGCCTSNPCNGIGCPASDLRAAGMGIASGPDVGVPNDGSYWPNVQCSVGQWWTCALQTPSFQGCCESNPCGGSGCPAGKLHAAAFLSVTSATAALTTLASSAKTTLAVSTSKVSVTDSSSAPSSLSTSQQVYTTTLANGAATTATIVIIQTAVPVGGSANITTSSSPNIAVIAGGAAGGAVVILILAFAIWWGCRKRKRRTEEKSSRLASAYESSRGPPGAPVRSQEKKSAGLTADVHEAYYPGQPIFNVPLATKVSQSPNLISLNSPPVTPGPPPYRSPNAEAHEIDSRTIYEVGSGYIPVSVTSSPAQVQELESPDPQGNMSSTADAIELPASPNSQRGSRWSLRRPVGLGLGMGARGVVERGSDRTRVSGFSDGELSAQSANAPGGRRAGNRESGGSASGVSEASPMRNSYTAWENWDHR